MKTLMLWLVTSYVEESGNPILLFASIWFGIALLLGSWVGAVFTGLWIINIIVERHIACNLFWC